MDVCMRPQVTCCRSTTSGRASSITDIEHSPNYTAFGLLQTRQMR